MWHDQGNKLDVANIILNILLKAFYIIWEREANFQWDLHYSELFKIYVCDAIKQNESEVGQIQFLFFWFNVYIICKAPFYNRPHWNWSITSKDTGSWRVANIIGTKKLSALFSYISKSVFVSSDSFCLSTSRAHIENGWYKKVQHPGHFIWSCPLLDHRKYQAQGLHRSHCDRLQYYVPTPSTLLDQWFDTSP